MGGHKLAVLHERGVVRVAGDDALKLLQGLITNELEDLKGRSAIFSGLLTPQGKILFEFFVVPSDRGFLLDTLKDKVPDLIKRLNFYKLRAKVTVSDASADYAIVAIWDGAAAATAHPPEWLAYADPRLPGLGLGSRALAPRSEELNSVVTASPDDYHAHRVALGVPEGGRDYTLGDSYPHEALYDQLAGVDFSKGCYVGQEIVSRMQHRGTARKRVVPVNGDAPLASGMEVNAGAAVIGAVGSVSGARGLALLRLDRAGEALAKDDPLTAGGIPIRIDLPPWVHFDLKTKAHGVDA